MKRIAVVGCVALVVALFSSLAYAATVKHFKGPVDKGGTIAFSALRDQGKYTRAGLFELKGIPVKCNNGTTTRAHLSTSNAVDVTNRHFTYTFNFGPSDPATAKVSGQFNRKGNKATGTFTLSHATYNANHQNCGTKGSRDWTAHRL
jgi:hypothetical protein